MSDPATFPPGAFPDPRPTTPALTPNVPTVDAPEGAPPQASIDVAARAQANHTAEGLEVYDHFPVLEAIYQAWVMPGYNPNWHEMMRRNVRRDMPVLARALDRLEAQGHA